MESHVIVIKGKHVKELFSSSKKKHGKTAFQISFFFFFVSSRIIITSQALQKDITVETSTT